MGETIAVLGTGTMGAPMVRNLVAAGLDVRAWNRTRERAEGLGAQVGDDPASTVRGARFVMTVLSAGDAVEAVARDMLAAMDDGAIWIQSSTVGMEATDTLIGLAADAGVPFVDAPVLGTKQPAEDGKLSVLASGPDDALDACEPVFGAIGAKTFRLGEAGAGTRAKLVVNTWLLALVEGLAETVALAERLGTDPQTFLEIIDGGPLFAPYAKLKGAAMISGDLDPSFSLELAAKDAGLVERAAAEAGLDLPLVRAVAAQLARGVQDGHGEQDMAATVHTARGG
jgi:3-hydroxyisobutyrate dehydrogenase